MPSCALIDTGMGTRDPECIEASRYAAPGISYPASRQRLSGLGSHL